MPEDKDADWSWDDFTAKINDELVGTYANYVHRVLSFTHNHYGEIPERNAPTPRLNDALDQIRESAAYVAQFIELCQFKKGIKAVIRSPSTGTSSSTRWRRGRSSRRTAPPAAPS